MISDKQLPQSEESSFFLSDGDQSQQRKRARHDRDNDDDCRRIIRRLDETLNIDILRNKESPTLDAYYSGLSHILEKIKKVKEEQQEALMGGEKVASKDSNNNVLPKKDLLVEEEKQKGKEQQHALKADHNVQPRSKLGEVINNMGNDVLFQVLGFLNVVAIDKKQIVCKQWKDCCEKVTESRGRVIKKAFENNEELHENVKKYAKGDIDDIETIAGEYGYPIGKWNVSQITDFSSVFARVDMNEDISEWNVANAENMEGMFYRNKTFNQDLSSWDTSNVTDMSAMFAGATMFNQDLSSWNVQNVTNTGYMFEDAASFNQDLSFWDVSNITEATNMFYRATSFNQDLSSWDFSEFAGYEDMFRGATSFDPRLLPSYRVKLSTDEVGI